MRQINSVRNLSNASRIPTPQMVLRSAATAVVLLACSAQAATYTYNQTTSNTVGTPDQWNTGTAWTGSVAPVSATDTVLDFGGAATLLQSPADTIFSNNDIPGIFQLQQLKVTYKSNGNNNLSSEIPTLGISGNALEFTSGGSMFISAGNTAGSRIGWRVISTINNDLRLSGDMTFDAASSQANVLGGVTLLNDNLSRTLTFTGAHTGFRSTGTTDNTAPTAASSSTFGGNINNAAGTGITSVSKTGIGLWSLTGNNGYTGGTSGLTHERWARGISSVAAGLELDGAHIADR